MDALTDLPSDVLATLKTVFNSIETFFSSTFNKLVGVFNKPVSYAIIVTASIFLYDILYCMDIDIYIYIQIISCFRPF